MSLLQDFQSFFMLTSRTIVFANKSFQRESPESDSVKRAKFENKRFLFILYMVYNGNGCVFT